MTERLRRGKRERRNGLVHEVLQPEGWPAPSGYVNGVSAKGRMVFTGGLVGWDATGAFADGIAAQVKQTLANALAVLAQGGAGPEHIVRMTWYVTDVEAYLAARKAIGAAYVETDRPALPADGGGRGRAPGRAGGDGRDRDHRGGAGVTRPHGGVG